MTESSCAFWQFGKLLGVANTENKMCSSRRDNENLVLYQVPSLHRNILAELNWLGMCLLLHSAPIHWFTPRQWRAGARSWELNPGLP